MKERRKKYVIRKGSILDKLSKFMKIFDLVNIKNEKVLIIWIAILTAGFTPFVVDVKAFAFLTVFILFSILILEVYDDDEE